MRKVLQIALIISLSGSLYAQELREVENNAFKCGEFLKYNIYYDSWLLNRFVAGIGTMKVSDQPVLVNGRETYHIEVTGNSVGVFNWFYKVRDRFETYLDTSAFIPWKFVRHTREGKFVLNDQVYFDHLNNYAQSSRNKKDIPEYVQDIVSVFYYMRTLDFDTTEVNDEYYMDFFLDDSVYVSRIVFLGRETVETGLGVFRCLKFKPQVAQGEVFQEPYPMVLWITDDENKIPVLGSSSVFIGRINIELIEYDGLLHGVAKRRK